MRLSKVFASAGRGLGAQPILSPLSLLWAASLLALVPSACSRDNPSDPDRGDGDDGVVVSNKKGAGGSAQVKEGTPACFSGDEGCGCYGNDTCNGTLSCLSRLCVNALPNMGGSTGGGSDNSQEGSDTCNRGDEGCSCEEGGSCKGLLSCLSQLCVNAMPGLGGASGDGASGSAGGGTGEGGSVALCEDDTDEGRGDCDWMRLIESFRGDDSATSDRAYDVVVDRQRGHIFVTGEVEEVLPGQQKVGFNLPDAYLQKYDSAGTLLWTRQFGSINIDTATGVALDAQGDVYVVGARNYFEERASGAYDAYLEKFDRDGVPIFTEFFKSKANEWANAVAVDPSGNIAVVGQIGRKEVDEEDASFIGEDFSSYVQSYDPQGDTLWTDVFPSLTYNKALDVDTDATGNIVVVGISRGGLEGQSETADLVGYARKYDSTGSMLWTLRFEDAAGWSTENSKIAIDSNGDIVVTSTAVKEFYYDVDDDDDDVDRGTQYSYRSLVRKLDSRGNQLWSWPIDSHIAMDIDLRADGEILLAGHQGGGSYLELRDSSGAIVWGSSLAGDVAHGVASFGMDSVAVVGNWRNDPSAQSFIELNGFVQRLWD